MAAVSSEQLIALQQEIAALVRAGVPLDVGLQSLAADLPGKFGRFTSDLAQRLERGESLDDALGSLGREERVYGAVLTAGLRAGNPATALESVVNTARRYQQLRSSLWSELAYPLLLLITGYFLLAFSLQKIVPVDVEASRHFDASNPWIEGLQTAHEAVTKAGSWPLLAVGLAVVAIVVLVRRGTSLRADPGGSLNIFTRIRGWHAVARFCDLLALQVEHAVPLPEALHLAGAASGWKQVANKAQALSERLQKGERPAVQLPLPVIVTWLVGAGRADTTQTTEYVQLLRREADHYRRRAERLSRWTVTWLPLAMTVVIGTTYLVLLAVVNLGPFLNLLFRLSQADNG